MFGEPKELDERAILVIGFLGAIVFAGLVFVLQDQQAIDDIVNNYWHMSPFGSYYFQVLITTMALSSLCFIFSCINMMFTSTDEKLLNSKVRFWSWQLFIIGSSLLYIFVPFLLAPFTLVGAGIVFAFEVVVIDRFAKWSRKR